MDLYRLDRDDSDRDDRERLFTRYRVERTAFRLNGRGWGWVGLDQVDGLNVAIVRSGTRKWKMEMRTR
jgi:hypothetical protein